MAVMTTVLTETVSNQGNTVTYMTPTHTAEQAKLVIQKSTAPTGNGVMLLDRVIISYASYDTSGALLGTKDVMEISYRRNVSSDPAIETAIQTLAEEILASDNFDDVRSRQERLQ